MGLIRQAMIFAVLGTMFLGIAAVNAQADYLEKSYPIAVHCSSQGELCDPAFSVPIETGSVLQVKYIVPNHCCPISLHIYVDDVLVRDTGLLGWPGATGEFSSLPLDTGFIDLGSVSPGSHTISLKAEGHLGGCNVGDFLQAWEGTLVVRTSSESGSLPVENYWGFDEDFDGWERIGSTAPWHDLKSGITWNDQWGGAQGVIAIDACETQDIHASGGIKKVIAIPSRAQNLRVNVIKEKADGGIRFLVIDSEGSHTIGDEILSGEMAKSFSYDISPWAGKTVTLEIIAYGTGTQTASDCSGGGKCCHEWMGVDWIKITHGADETDTSNVPQLITQLESLARLRDQGILTEEEFQQQKTKILNVDKSGTNPETNTQEPSSTTSDSAQYHIRGDGWFGCVTSGAPENYKELFSTGECTQFKEGEPVYAEQGYKPNKVFKFKVRRPGETTWYWINPNAIRELNPNPEP